MLILEFDALSWHIPCLASQAYPNRFQSWSIRGLSTSELSYTQSPFETDMRISTESPSRLGVAYADRMGSNVVNIMAGGDMWNHGLWGVVRCRVEDDRATNRQIQQAARAL